MPMSSGKSRLRKRTYSSSESLSSRSTLSPMIRAILQLAKNSSETVKFVVGDSVSSPPLVGAAVCTGDAWDATLTATMVSAQAPM